MTTPETTPVDIDTPRPCTRCKGLGRTHNQYLVDAGHETAAGRPCHACDGAGTFPGLQVKAIADALFTTRGKGGKKAFRKSFPSKAMDHYKDRFAARVYYVWRLARFHGGADVTMPMTADMVTSGDPFKRELDVMADRVARIAFGTDMAAAHRWGGLLGFGPRQAPAGLPPAAYEGGPVADEEKPEWEALELR